LTEANNPSTSALPQSGRTDIDPSTSALPQSGRTDLHTHTTASDGSFAPAELVAMAVAAGIAVLGITDHDTTAGLSRAHAAAAELGLTVVDGIELNCDEPHRHTDLLGYLMNVDDPEFQDLIAATREARVQRARIMVDKLRALGADITFDSVEQASAGGSVGRPHVAQALIDSGFVPNAAAAFRDYIGASGPAYADRLRLTPEEAIGVIRDAGGVPVLAHPVSPASAGPDEGVLRRFLARLTDAGLGGVECYYPGYTPKTTRWLAALAGHFSLVPSGGSDFHGPRLPDRVLGTVPVPADTLARLRAAR
jgi:predicted metal-dependent phosphoesterase TrpH